MLLRRKLHKYSDRITLDVSCVVSSLEMLCYLSIAGPCTFTPMYSSVSLFALICSMAVRPASPSTPNVTVFTVFCFLENQSNGVLLTKIGPSLGGVLHKYLLLYL